MLGGTIARHGSEGEDKARVVMNELQITEDRQGLQLREYLAVLRVRKWWIVLATVLVVASALAYSLQQTPVYVSQAQVFVSPIDLSGTNTNPIYPTMANEIAIANSTEVARLVDPNENPYALKANLSVSQDSPDSTILTFQYSSPDPQVAKQRAEAFAKAYLDNRQEGVFETLQDQAKAVQERISALREQVTQATDPDIREGLKGYITVLLSQGPSLTATATNVGQIIQHAALPLNPTSPNHVKTGILALLAGLPLGAGLAFLRERFDDRLRGRADLETHAGAAVLAVVPRVSNWKNSADSPVVTLVEPKSPAAEAYRTLRTSVLFAAAQRGLHTLMVTSSHAQEGKSSTTANLGVALAQSGKRVIIVSADLRKPRLHRFFRAQNGMGLTNVLAGEKNALEVLNWVGVENLRLLPSGPVPGNPAELLGSDAMGSLLRELREASDFVLIDAAPVLPVADAMTLTPVVDAALFVADARRTTRGAIEQARHQLDQVNARVIGTVLNNFDPSKSSYSHSQYGYTSYRIEEPADRSRSRVLTWGSRRG
jgi:polysaccharide biosynthesis transport protein